MTPITHAPDDLNTATSMGRLRIRLFYFIAFIEMETLTEPAALLCPFLAMWVAWVNTKECQDLMSKSKGIGLGMRGRTDNGFVGRGVDVVR
jgi:hypothetical protein